MSEEAAYLTLTEVAKRADVGLSAVSNWRIRHADFPAPHVVSGQELFETNEVARWLRKRAIPRNRLKPDERPGTTYGDRFLRDASVSGPPVATAAPQTGRHLTSDPVAALWAAADVLRGTHDPASSLELLLGLVYVRTCLTDAWRKLADSSDWPEIHDVLAGVSLSMGAGTQALPVFRALSQTADSSLMEAVRLLGRIDFGIGDGSQATSARLADAILDNLERGMGKNGGHFTPPDVAQCLVALLDPRRSDRVYDPFCGSGELLCAAAAHVRSQNGSREGWRVYGQTPHEWSWLTSAMNLALHGVDADLSTPAYAVVDDRFLGQRFSRILANPPFNLGMKSLEGRVWPFGEPPSHNANFAWLQHVVTKLEAGGRAAVVMPDGAASAGGKERAIRQAMVEGGVVECVIALPPRLFRFTAIPTMVWILRGADAGPACPETLFIDARSLGETVDRTRRRLGAEDIERIVDAYWTWRSSRVPRTVEGTDGFSRSAGQEEISRNDYNLAPARYTSAATKHSDTARVIGEIGALRDEFDELSKRAEEVRTALGARLAAVIRGQRPGEGGRFVSLGTICEVIPGPGTVSRDDRQPTGTPLVLPRNIRNNRVDADDLDVVATVTADRMATRYRLVPGDIVSARAGTLGRYGLVLAEQAGWLLGPGCVRFRPNGQADPDYLTYYLGGPAARHWLTEHATGSVIQHVNAATLRSMPIWLPPLPVQRAIVEFVKPFDTAASTYGRISATTRELHELLVTVLMSP